MSTNNEGLTIQDINNEKIQSLIQEKERLVNEGKYMEADRVKQQIKELKANTLSEHNKNLCNAQDQDNEGLEEAFTEEFEEATKIWDNKVNAFIEEGKKMEENLREKHKADMEDLIKKLTDDYPPIKYSSEYLQNKSIEMKLAKMEKYKKAAYYKNICDKLAIKENKIYENKRNQTIQIKAEALSKKQTNEFKILREKLDIQFELLNQKKENDLNSILLKYKNIKNDLDQIHKKQKYRDPALKGNTNAGLNRIKTLINTRGRNTANSTQSNKIIGSKPKVANNNNSAQKDEMDGQFIDGNQIDGSMDA